MTPEDFIDRNIAVLHFEADKESVLTTSRVQSICRIGYNQAERTIDEMLKRGIIKVGEVEREYRFNRPTWRPMNDEVSA